MFDNVVFRSPDRVARAVGQGTRHEKTGHPVIEPGEREEAVAHRRRAEPLVAADLVHAIADRIGEVGILLGDVAGELAGYADDLDADPLLLSAVYYLAFGILLGTKKDNPDFLVFLVGGVFTWQLFASTIQNGSMVLANTKDLTEALLFPRVLLPIAVAVQEALGALGSAVVMYPIALAYGLTPRWQWLLLPFTFILTSLFGLGVSLFTARWVDKIFDLRQFIPLILRVGMFLSGVFYDVTIRFAKAPHIVQTIANFNPAAIESAADGRTATRASAASRGNRASRAPACQSGRPGP